MTTVAELLTYAELHNIRLITEAGRLVIEAGDDSITEDFLASAKQHKQEIISALTSRWNPELVGYVWCCDCQYWNNRVCTHPDNRFKNQCAQAPRKCRWYAPIQGV